MGTPYAITFIDYLKEEILKNSLLTSLVWWRYTDDTFMMWENEEEELKMFLNKSKVLNAIILLKISQQNTPGSKSIF